MGGTHDTWGRREMHTEILLGNLKETTAKILAQMGEKKIKMIIKGEGKRGDSVEWVDLAQGRDNWRAVMNTVRNLWLP
jgi:hypothetical protein